MKILTPIEVFSNADEVELKVNRKTIGTVKPDELKSFRWNDVAPSKGKNTIKVTALFGNGQKLTDTCVWEYIPGLVEEYVGKPNFVWKEKILEDNVNSNTENVSKNKKWFS